MSTRTRRIFGNLALLAGSVLFATLAAEAVLRIFPALLPAEARLRLEWAESTSNVRSVGDPYLGTLNPPDTTIEVRQGDFTFSYRTDEHGFRNPSPWPDSVDVLIVGDSETMGYGVQDAEAWPRLLERELDGDRVITLGVSGAGPKQYLRNYERFGLALAPRVLLFGLFPGNDFDDARQFELWLAAGAPGNFHVWRYFGGKVPDVEPKHRFFSLSNSRLLVALRAARKAARLPFSGKTLTFPDGSHMVLAPTVYRSAVTRAHPGHRDFELVLDQVEEARRLAEPDGTRFVVLLFPTKEEVYMSPENEATPHLVEPLAAALKHRGIPYLDLTPGLRSEAEAGRRLFFKVDGHPDAAGNRVIADIVLRGLDSLAVSGTGTSGEATPATGTSPGQLDR